MSARILHVSDLHVGVQEPAGGGPDLAALVERVSPDLVVVSGDLTHGGRRVEHARAAARLRDLERPLLVVPGNHDIPPLSPARFLQPWAAFEAEWETTEPVFATEALQVVGLNSVRPVRYQAGAVSEAQLGRAVVRLDAGRPGAARVVVLHHQLANPPWRSRKRPLARRTEVLDRLTAAGATLIVGGHTHQAAVTERREFDARPVTGGPVILSTAPGLGNPRPRRRGEARGAVVYAIDTAEIAVETYRWADGWSRSARRIFPRRDQNFVSDTSGV